jgi:hypothetical protein
MLVNTTASSSKTPPFGTLHPVSYVKFFISVVAAEQGVCLFHLARWSRQDLSGDSTGRKQKDTEAAQAMRIPGFQKAMD